MKASSRSHQNVSPEKLTDLKAYAEFSDLDVATTKLGQSMWAIFASDD